MGHIDLRKVKGFWNKADLARDALQRVVVEHADIIEKVVIENPVKRFRSGHSSANTIALLSRFNAVVSLFVRDTTSYDPLYVGANDARRGIGVVLQTKKKAGGKTHKEQTFEQLNEGVFKGHPWPRTRQGNIQVYCYDECDAYVIALAGSYGMGELEG